MEIFGFIFPLAILAVVVYGIVLVVNRARGRADRAAPGIGTRQAFFYLFAFAALMVALSGASLLVGYVVDTLRDDSFVSPSNNQLALGIALTLVGTPAWLITWRRILKTTESDPHEAGSAVRGLYIYLIEAISIGFIVTGMISLIGVFLGVDHLEGTDIAYPLVWGGIWAYHWWLDSKITPADRDATPFRSIYVYAASILFLVMTLVGIGIILQRLFDRAYVSLFIDNIFVEPELWGDAIRISVALILIGSVGWWWHWLRTADREPESTLRQVYVYVFGVLFGVVTVVVAVSSVFVVVLQWLLSTPSISPGDEHFRVLTGLIPALLAGTALWGYHAAVLSQESTATGVASARRIYNYLIASLSLATLATGFVFLIALFVSATSRDARNYLIDRAGWQGQLSVVLPLLLVGGGIWLYYWWQIQKSVKTAPLELETSSRRIHIYSVFGVGALAALGSLSALLFMFIDSILDSSFSSETFRDAQWALGVLLSTGLISAYYLIIIREDRRILAVAQPVTKLARKSVTVLVPEELVSVANQLESSLGYGIELWAQPGTGLASRPSPEQIEEAALTIRNASDERLLVIVGDSGLEVIPYRQV